MRYFVWWRLGESGWLPERLFVVDEQGVVIDGAPSQATPLMLGDSLKVAVDRVERNPDRERLEETDEATATTYRMEIDVRWAKRWEQMELPAGAYFVLWAGADEYDAKTVAYGRVLERLGGTDRLILVLGVDAGPTPLLSGVWEAVDSEKGGMAVTPSDLAPGGIYILDAYGQVDVEKAYIRRFRAENEPGWTHAADDDLDASGGEWEGGSRVSLGEVRKKKRVSRRRAENIAEKVAALIEPHARFLLVVGSIRRRLPEVSDVEIVVLPRDLGRFLAWVEEVGFSGGDRIRRKVVDGVKVELFIAHHAKELGALVFHTTGDWQFNVAMRRIAIRKGLKLNQYGLWKGSRAVLQSEDERDFFKALGVRYHDPEERSFASRGR